MFSKSCTQLFCIVGLISAQPGASLQATTEYSIELNKAEEPSQIDMSLFIDSKDSLGPPNEIAPGVLLETKDREDSFGEKRRLKKGRNLRITEPLDSIHQHIQARYDENTLGTSLTRLSASPHTQDIGDVDHLRLQPRRGLAGFYELRKDLKGPRCPESFEVNENECLAAALEVGGSYLLPTVLNANDWTYTPCGCFLWQSTSGVLIDYDRGQSGECKVHDSTIGMVCKKASDPKSALGMNGVAIGSGTGYISVDSISIKKMVQARGHDIWGTDDGFFFLEQAVASTSYLSSSFQLELYSQNSFDNPSSLHEWAKFGLMVRNSLDANAKHFSVLLTPSKGVHALFRQDQGGLSTRIVGNDFVRGGGWLKIERNANMFRAYYKKDPVTDDEETFYTIIGETAIDMSGEIHVGIALCSHNVISDAVARFETFTVKELSSVWSNAIGSNATGSLSDPVTMIDGRSTNITGKGVDIWGSVDSFFFSSVTVPDTSNGQIFRMELFSERGFGVSSSSNTWAKFGLMVRQTVDASSQHFSVFLTPSNGVHAFYRQYQGGASTWIAGNLAIRGGGWLMIERSGDDFRAFFRQDKATSYTLIGQANIPMSGYVKAGVALTSKTEMSDTISFSLFSLKIGASPLMFVAQEGDRTNCLKANGNGKALLKGSCFYSDATLGFRYSESTGQLSAGFGTNGTCATYVSSTESRLEQCDMGKQTQRWVYYNHQFYLSKDSEMKLKVSGVDRWTKGNQVQYRPNAIVLSGSRSLQSHLCLSEKSSVVDVQYCKESPAQSFSLSDDGLIKNSAGKCLSRTDRGIKAPGMTLSMVDCKYGDQWHWRDGSIYLDVDEEYLIEANDMGGVMLGYIPNERSRSTRQRWLVESKRYSSYHRSTNSIRIRNEASSPMECSLSQLGPLYWGVIYPGEEFYRNTGAVHWTVSCSVVLNGVGRIRIGDAIWPISDLIVAILVTIATAGAGLGQAATFAVKQVVGMTMSLLRTNDFAKMMEVLAWGTASTGIGKVGGLLGVTGQATASAISKTLKSSAMSIASAMVKVPLQSFMTKVAPAAFDAVCVGQNTTSQPALTKFLSNEIIKLAGNSSVSGLVNDAGFSTAKILFTASNAGQYANGKLYVIRGGPSLTADGSTRQEPLRLELYEENKKLALERCENNDDCLNGGCAMLAQSDSEKYCCGENSYFGLGSNWNNYCHGTVAKGGKCWFHAQCEGEGYCEGLVCKAAKSIGAACNNDDECRKSIAYCDGTCKEKIGNLQSCTQKKHCLSGACGRNDPGGNLNCCESGDTFTLYYYDAYGRRNSTDGCTGVKKDQEVCYSNHHCVSDYCMGSNGSGTKGKCLGPYNVGENCDEGDGEDDQCVSKECGLEEAGSNNYVCCADEAIEHSFIDYCNRLADGKSCWLDVMCKSGYCAGNGGGTYKGQCATKNSVDLGGSCYDGNDEICKSGLGCALDQRDGVYVCCQTYGSYAGFEYCYGMADGKKCWSDVMCSSGFCGNGVCTRRKNKGEQCPTTVDKECVDGLECGKKTYWDSTYVCCNDAFVPDGWTTDLCVVETSGQRCGTTEDRECAGTMGCALDQRDGVYVCCYNVGTYGGLDYCYGMADGKRCHSDAMCSSGFCDGVCIRRKKEGEKCPTQKDRECLDNGCWRSTRYGDYTCCKETNYCDTWNPGCTTGYWYCKYYGDRLG